jgi:hypothetical protein
VDDWLRDPAAIETLVKLGGLQVGDEVMLQNCIDISIDHELERRRPITITAVPPKYLTHGVRRYVPEAFMVGDRWCVNAVAEIEGHLVIALFNIAAWRRPTQGDKE